MPLEKIVVESDRAWALWQIAEDEQSLMSEISPYETISHTITNAQKRLEWLAGRVLTKYAMEALGMKFQGVTKDEYGKPSPTGFGHKLSLSHSFPHVAVLIDQHQAVGIDLEQPKEKLLKIAPRIHHHEELQDAGTNIVKHCIYWCAKETLVKFYGKKDLIFAENLFINPFRCKKEDDITGKITIGGMESVIPLHYITYSNFVVVFTSRSQL